MKMQRMGVASVGSLVQPVLAGRLTPNERFKALCSVKGWTPEQAAEKFGVSLSLVQAWTTVPTSDRYRAMRKPYELIMDALYVARSDEATSL